MFMSLLAGADADKGSSAGEGERQQLFQIVCLLEGKLASAKRDLLFSKSESAAHQQVRNRTVLHRIVTVVPFSRKLYQTLL